MPPGPPRHGRRRSHRLALAGLIIALVTVLPAGAGEYSAEGDFLARINALRESAGVAALVPDAELAAIARAWASEMAAAGAISHNPRLSELITGARSMAENVGVGPGVGSIEEALEASPGHRRNLLDADMTRVGIGVVHEKGSLWVVEDFKQPTGHEPDPPVTQEAVAEPPATVPEASPTLVFDSSFEEFGEGGVAAGLSTWGKSSFAPVADPVHSGQRAQRVQVDHDATGGAWFAVPVRPGTSYAQSVQLDVLSLDRWARAELIVEWFDASSTLIAYKLLPIADVSNGFVPYRQVAEAPPNAATARFVVNIKGGGSYVLDDARLEAMSPPGG
jgi:hypothetical protein